MVKKVLILLALFGVGLASGTWLADYLRAADRAEAADAVRVVPSNTTKVYSIKRMPAEGICVGRKYSFYGKGFEVLQLELGIANGFSISSSYPVSIEFKKGCGTQTGDIDELCKTLLGAYLTMPRGVDPMLRDFIGDTYLPVSGERKDKLFDDIQTLPEFRSKYHFVSLKRKYHSYPDEGYDYYEPKLYTSTYSGNLGAAKIEKKKADYQLEENEGAVFKLLVVCLIGGGALGIGIGFGLLRVASSRQRLKAIKQA
jgi:hypothetical protein